MQCRGCCSCSCSYIILVLAASFDVISVVEYSIVVIVAGSLEVTLPTTKKDGKAEVGKVRGAPFFHFFVALEDRKVGSLKRRCGAIWPDER